MDQSRRNSNTEIAYQDLSQEDVESMSIDNEAMIKKEPSPDEVLHVRGPAAPASCPCYDGSYEEQLPAPESSISEGAKNDEKVHKYLEIVHDNKTEKQKSSDEDQHESVPEEPVACTTERSSASRATLNIEMTYLHKKDEEKVEMCRYMTLDDDAKRMEDIGRYEAPCTSTAGVSERPAVREGHLALGVTPNAENFPNTDDEYDEVMTESENSSDSTLEGYEEPDALRVTTGATSTPGETSVYQELQYNFTIMMLSIDILVAILQNAKL